MLDSELASLSTGSGHFCRIWLPARECCHQTGMDTKININTSGAKQLTQLPGVAKNLAYSIVSHRERHGLFTHWEELAEVKGFPADAIDAIKARATLAVPGEVEEGTSPRRLKARPAAKDAKKPTGYTRKIRTTRRSERMKHSA
jgi:competence ComEA-like helix-hairpin-helix protein